MKKLFLIILLFLFVTPVYAIDLKSKNVIMYNLNEDSIIYSLNEHEKVKVASLTKMMTTIVAIENNSDLNKYITMSKQAFIDLDDYSVAGFTLNEKVTINDLLYGVMLPSGAEAAQQLAITTSGNMESFIILMNKKASELGMNDTHFSNVIGKDIDNYSTAYDMGLLLKYCIKNDIFYKIFTTKSYTVNNKTLYSTISTYSKTFNIDTSYIIGSKTGFTEEAGVSLASIATINNINYALITLNADYTDRTAHLKDSINLYNYFNDNYSYKTVGKNNQLIKIIKVKDSLTKTYNITLTEDVKFFLKNDTDLKNVKYEYKGAELITKDYNYKDKIGTVYFYLDEVKIGESEVYLNQEIKFYDLRLIISIILISILFILVTFKKLLKNS